MLKNYLKSALRNLLRQKGYSFINVAGLTIGLACCMLIVQYVVFQTTFDDFHEHVGDLYRIRSAETQNGETNRQAMIGYAPAPIFAADAPEIVHYTRVHPEYGSAIVTRGDVTFREDGALYVDSTFLQMFSFPLLRGNARTVLREPRTLLLSQAAAERYFGSEDPLGQSLHYTGWIEGDFTVVGILDEVPATSHLQFDFLLPMADLLESPQYQSDGAGWGWSNFLTYVQLRPDADRAAVESKLTDVMYRHEGENIEARNATVAMQLQPLRDVHLDDETFGGVVQGTDPTTVYFFSIVAFVTLVIALINYVNLATARAMDRAREVGVRKVVGAHRNQLMGQFLLESVLMNLTALLLALGISVLATPFVNEFAGTELGPETWTSPWFTGIFVGVFVLGILLSGLYPAFVLSSFRPALVLKSGKVVGGRAGLRKALVVAQFAASIMLLIGTGIVVSQVRYMRNHDVGLALDQILIVSSPRVLPTGTDPGLALRTFADEISSISGVSSHAFSNSIPGRGFSWYSNMRRATADPSTARDARAAAIDHQFLHLYGIDMAAGEPFVENMARPADGQPPQVLINRTVVDVLGFSDDQEALNQMITMGGGDFVVRGVVKNFNWSSLHQQAEAVMFQYAPAANFISFKVASANLPAIIADIRGRFEDVFEGNPFEYTFADAAFAEQYRNDERFARLFGIFAGFAILIACLGLFGLAAFTAESRTKEIGVRKVLGASVVSIVALLSREFLALVGIALVAAIPAAWYFMRGWLDNFAYQIDLGPGIFLASGAATLLIALLTVSYKSVRAATVDPAKSLRYE